MRRLIAFEELTSADESAWRDLAGRCTEPNPFYEADAVLAAHRHLRPRGVALLVTGERDGWSACLPVRRLGPAGAHVALRSWLHLYAFYGMPLIDRDKPVEALRSVLAAALDRPGPGLVALDCLPGDGPAAAVIHDSLVAEGLATVVTVSHERATLLRREQGDYLDHLGRHHQREANRLGRRLEEELGAPLTIRDRAVDAAAVETFLGLERSGWKGHEGTAMSCDSGHAAYFRELCARFRADGRLQLLALEAGGRTVAMKCNLAAAGTLFCFKIAQDGELDRFSPGVRLERANVECFHLERPEQWMDSCAAADNKMINRLWPDRRRISSVVIGRRDLRTAIPASLLRVAARRGVRATGSVRSRLRLNPNRREPSNDS